MWLIQPYVLHPQQWPCFILGLARQGGESNTFTLPESETAIQRDTYTHIVKHTEETWSDINYKMVFHCLQRALCSCVQVLNSSVTASWKNSKYEFKWKENLHFYQVPCCGVRVPYSEEQSLLKVSLTDNAGNKGRTITQLVQHLYYIVCIPD